MRGQTWQDIVAGQTRRIARAAVSQRCNPCDVVRAIGTHVDIVSACRARVSQYLCITAHRHTGNRHLTRAQAVGAVIGLGRRNRRSGWANGERTGGNRDVAVVGVGVAA